MGVAYAKASKERQIQKNISKKSTHCTIDNSKRLKAYLTSIILMNQVFVSRPISPMLGRKKDRRLYWKVDQVSA